MNAITQRNAGTVTVPARVQAPALPERVAAHIQACEAYAAERARWASLNPDQREDTFVGIRPQLPALTEAERGQLERAAGDLAAQMVPVSLAQLRAWLAPVNAAVRNPQSAEDFAIRCQGIHAMVDDLPAGAFTAEARKALPDFFPAAANIRAAVEPGSRRLLALATALRNATNPVKPAEPEATEARGPRTLEEITAVRAKVQAFMAERNAVGSPTELPPVRPSYLKDTALVVALQAVVRAGGPGAGAAKFRLEALMARKHWEAGA